jgi:hypothetical protein
MDPEVGRRSLWRYTGLAFPRTQRRDQVTVTHYVGRPGFDHVVAVGRITLAEHSLAGGQMERFQTARKLLDGRQRQRLETWAPL